MTTLTARHVKEAEARAGGDELGPAGGRIESYLSVEPDWRPTLREDDFGIADLLMLTEGS